MSDEATTGGKGLLTSALLVAAVVAILLAGFVLRSEPQNAASRPPVAPVTTPSAPALGPPVVPEAAAAEPPSPVLTPAPELAAPELPKAGVAKPRDTPPPAPAIDAAIARLAVRAESDADRLAKGEGRWTAQLLVACKADTVDRLLGRSGGSTKVFVLPARVHDDPCFRVCYGTYATATAAAAAADLPKSLRGSEKIAAMEIVKVIP